MQLKQLHIQQFYFQKILFSQKYSILCNKILLYIQVFTILTFFHFHNQKIFALEKAEARQLTAVN